MRPLRPKETPVRGTYVRRLMALIAVCLAAVTAAAQASTKSGLEVNVTAGLNTASFSVGSNQPTTLALNIGTTKAYGLELLDGSSKSHDLNIRGLAPGTTYFYSARMAPVE